MPRFALFLFATRNNPELGIMAQAVQGDLFFIPQAATTLRIVV